jgi:Fe-S-cluster containining protein
MNAVQECLECGAACASGLQGRLVVTIATGKTEDQIPDARRPLWEALRELDAIELEFIEPGWSAGAVRRV